MIPESMINGATNLTHEQKFEQIKRCFKLTPVLINHINSNIGDINGITDAVLRHSQKMSDLAAVGKTDTLAGLEDLANKMADIYSSLVEEIGIKAHEVVEGNNNTMSSFANDVQAIIADIEALNESQANTSKPMFTEEQVEAAITALATCGGVYEIEYDEVREALRNVKEKK